MCGPLRWRIQRTRHHLPVEMLPVAPILQGPQRVLMRVRERLQVREVRSRRVQMLR